MISISILDELAKRQQTTQLNIRREYVQHVFLSHFYRQTETDAFLFKGGTALRIVFGSPRFSEDLDFSSTLSKTKNIEEAVINTLKEIEREGIQTEIIEAKETTGGYLAEILFKLGSEQINILLQISKRNPKDIGEVATITSGFIPAYIVVLLDRKRLVAEKIQALFTRAKPRDFYDLYFLIRSNLLEQEEKELLVKAKKKLATTSINFEQELKQFLPKSHWLIIRNFKVSLEREIERLI